MDGKAIPSDARASAVPIRTHKRPRPLRQTVNVSIPEFPLTGGNASSFVVRAGNTVRKPWTESTPSVERLLKHLHDEVGDVVPKHLGRDDHGRQILEFVPGIEAMSSMPIDEADAARVGASIRALHEAAASFERTEADIWTSAMRSAGDEVLGHNDLAPWNLIRDGDRWTFIDWDGAGPATRVADLGYAARAFAQLDHEHELDESIPLLRAVLDDYDASPEMRTALPSSMVERTEAMRGLLIDSIATGTQPWASMAVDGHADFWAGALDHLLCHRTEIELALR